MKAVPKILKLDLYGRPIEWVGWQAASALYCKDKIAWEMGDSHYEIYGGKNKLSGKRSMIELNTIIAVRDHHVQTLEKLVPPLCNKTLFARDQNICLYCGKNFSLRELTRDHVLPTAQDGLNIWTNVVTACKRCNHKKANKTPEQAYMPLLSIPYAPNHAEYLILSNRRVLADQMSFLKKHVKNEKLLTDLKGGDSWK